MSANQALLRGRDSIKAQSMTKCLTEKKEKGDANLKMKILFANIGGIPIEHTNNKNVVIEKWIGESNADIIGLVETNICWRHAKNGPLQERMKNGHTQAQHDSKPISTVH